MPDAVMDQMSAWIADRQLENGAIALDAKEQRLVPDAANIGALGLLLRAETIPDVQRYIDWYTGHWNWGDRYGIYGTVDEFQYNGDTKQWSSTGAYRSASPGIASFITLLKNNYEKTGQFALSQTSLDLLTGGIGIMKSQDADGLMWKLPDEKTKYLRDNAVTYQGMKDSVWLFQNLFHAAGPANYFTSFTDMLHTGIQSNFWNEQEGWYYASSNEQHEKSAPNWLEKNSAAEQLSPIYTGVISVSSNEAKQLYAAYNRSFPSWSELENFSPTDASVVFTGALMGDWPRVSRYLGNLLTLIKSGKLPEDWTIEQTGYAMLAAERLKNSPSSSKVEIVSPKDGSISNGIGLEVKGTAANAKLVRIEWREKYGKTLGNETVIVQDNGKWHISLKNLKRGVIYELTASVLDEWHYSLPGTSVSMVYTNGKSIDSSSITENQ